MRLPKTKFSLSFAVLALSMTLLMLKAGFWQIDRAKQKRELQAGYVKVGEMSAIGLQQLPKEIDSLIFKRVQLSGRYEHKYQFLLDNRIYSKHLGYEVLTPFCLLNGDCVLVNRGWVESGIDRSELPDIEVSDEIQTIVGISYLPGRSFRIGSMDADQVWPRVVQYIDYEQMGERIDKPLFATTIILDADQAQRYRYNWQPVIDGPQKHYAYAVQWFGMAIMVVVLFVIFSIRQNKAT